MISLDAIFRFSMPWQSKTRSHGLANGLGTAKDHGLANGLGAAKDHGLAKGLGT